MTIMPDNARAECKHLDRPDEARAFEKGHIELVTVGGVMIGRVTFEPGWRWSECIQPLVGTATCQVAHTGYGLSGQLHIVMDDGSEFDTGPGEATHIPPGHDAWVLGDQPYISIDIELGTYAIPS